MTTPPNYVWLRSHSVFDTAEATKGSRRYDSRIYIGTMQAGGIIPSVEPWPHSADTNGVSFPSGLVGVRFSYYFADPVSNHDGSRLIAVPATLPGSYTARINRDYHNAFAGDGLNLNFGMPYGGVGLTMVGSAPHTVNTIQNGDFRLRLADGLHDYLWLPENKGQQCWTASVSLGFGGVWSAFPSIGVRYIRWITGIDTGVSGDTVEWRARITRNSDGSLGSDGTQGTDVEDEWTTSVSGTFGTVDSGVRVIDLESPGFQRSYFCFSLEVRVNGGAWSSSVSGTVKTGPLLNVPFPFTAAGWTPDGGNMCAPGGYLPGALDVLDP